MLFYSLHVMKNECRNPFNNKNRCFLLHFQYDRELNDEDLIDMCRNTVCKVEMYRVNACKKAENTYAVKYKVKDFAQLSAHRKVKCHKYMKEKASHLAQLSNMDRYQAGRERRRLRRMDAYFEQRARKRMFLAMKALADFPIMNDLETSSPLSAQIDLSSDDSSNESPQTVNQPDHLKFLPSNPTTDTVKTDSIELNTETETCASISLCDNIDTNASKNEPAPNEQLHEFGAQQVCLENPTSSSDAQALGLNSQHTYLSSGDSSDESRHDYLRFLPSNPTTDAVDLDAIELYIETESETFTSIFECVDINTNSSEDQPIPNEELHKFGVQQVCSENPTSSSDTQSSGLESQDMYSQFERHDMVTSTQNFLNSED